MDLNQSFRLPEADDLPLLDASQHWPSSAHRHPGNDFDLTGTSDEGSAASGAGSGDDEEALVEGRSVVCCQQTAFLPGLKPSEKLQKVLDRCQAYAHFYEILSPLKALERSLKTQHNVVPGPPVVLHTVLALGPGSLLTVAGGRWRTFSLREGSTADVKLVLVHHEPGPTLRHFVAVHRSDDALTLLQYKPLKVMAHFSQVRSVSSADTDGSGHPRLTIVKCSGERVRWSPLYGVDGDTWSPSAAAEQQRPPTTAAQRQVALALGNNLKRAVSQVSLLEHSCLRRQLFLSRHVEALRSVLSGRAAVEEEEGHGRAPTAYASRVPAPPPNVRQASTKHKPGAGLLSVSSVRWRLLHRDALVLCVTVHSAANRHLLSDLELVLHSQHPDPYPSSLLYSSSVFKSVQRRRKHASGLPSRTAGTVDGAASGDGADGRASATSIEPMRPCLLRPGKQAFIVAVCRLPSFVAGPTVSLCGLVQFRSKPLFPAPGSSPTSSKTKPGENNLPDQGTDAEPLFSAVLQVRIPSVSLDVRTIEKARVCLDRPTPRIGVSLDCVALVTGSQQQRVLITSRLCPISQQKLLEDLAATCTLTQVRNVGGLTVLCADRPSSPLHLAAFCMDPSPSSRALPATLFFRDKAQGVALIHAIRSVLPFDATVLPAKTDHGSLESNTVTGQRPDILTRIGHLEANECNTVRPTESFVGGKITTQAFRTHDLLCPSSGEKFERVLIEVRQIVQLLVDITTSGLFLYRAARHIRSSLSSFDNKRIKADGITTSRNTIEPVDGSTKSYEEERARFETAEKGVSILRHAYDAWKKNLRELQGKLDAAYVDACS